MSREPYYVSAEGLKKLEAKLQELKKNRESIIDRLREAKEMGDLSENAEYHFAREAHAMNETQIQELEELLKRATLIKKGKSSAAGIGSKITVKQGLSKMVFTIVGPEESDPGAGLISNESPVGRTLLGKKVADTVTVKNGLGKETVYKIVKIE
jgi:transcription elongation factor GreA